MGLQSHTFVQVIQEYMTLRYQIGKNSAAQLLLKIHTHVMDARQYWSLRRQEWEKTVASNYFCKVTHC